MTIPQSDIDVLEILSQAFGQVPRPDHFTVEDGDIECMEHDKLFHSYTPESLPIEPFLTAYSPLNELLPEGMKYYFPTFAKFTLTTSINDNAWSGEYLIYKLGDTEFRDRCDDLQKNAISVYLMYLRVSRKDLIEEFSSMEYFDRIFSIWKL